MILIIGRSEKFIKIIKESYSCEISVAGWREIKNINVNEHLNINNKNKIFLIGYDYNSYAAGYEKYKKTNIDEPINFLYKAIEKGYDFDIIYLNTKYKNKSNTFSRYFYAKHSLENKLSEFKNSFSLELNTVVNSDGSAMVNGGFANIMAFMIFNKFNLIETDSLNEVKYKIKNYEKYKAQQKKLKGILLYLPRLQIVDRLLRILIG